MTDKKIDKKQLRSFGLIVGGGFALIALAQVLRGHTPKTWVLVVAFVLAATALILPLALKPVFRAWMAVGELLGWVNTRIILFLVYYGVLVPIGAILRSTGKDLLRLKFEREAESYRIPRIKRAVSHMQRQY